MKYEAHITISISSEEEIKKIGLSSNWTFSKILGDPIMGKEAYCYLTKYKEDANELLKEMNAVASQIELNNCKVLRCKIELICYDTKTNVNILENISSFYHTNKVLDNCTKVEKTRFALIKLAADWRDEAREAQFGGYAAARRQSAKDLEDLLAMEYNA